METLHSWFIYFSILVMFICSIKYIMYYFGVNPVYDYFCTNSTDTRTFIFVGLMMYYLLSIMVVIIELGFGGYTNTDNLQFWLFVLILEMVPVVVFVCIVLPLKLLFKTITFLQMLHIRIIKKRRGAS